MSDEVAVNVMGDDGTIPCLQKVELVGYYSDGSTFVMTMTGALIEVDVSQEEPDYIETYKRNVVPPARDLKVTFEKLRWVGWVNHDPESTKVANPQSHGYKFEG